MPSTRFYETLAGRYFAEADYLLSLCADRLPRIRDDDRAEIERLRAALRLITERYYIRGGEKALEIATKALEQ